MRLYQRWEEKLVPLIERIPSFRRVYDGDISDFANNEVEAAIFVARGILQANSDISEKLGGARSFTHFVLKMTGLYQKFPDIDLIAIIDVATRRNLELHAEPEQEAVWAA